MTMHKIFVCRGTSCQSAKSEQLYNALKAETAKLGIKNVQIDYTGCHGFCEQGPIVTFEPDGFFYAKVKVEDAVDIAKSLAHSDGFKIVDRLLYKEPTTGKPIPYYKDIPFYALQTREILKKCGHMNPDRIEDYLDHDGYKALKKVLSQMTPEQVIDEIKKSGLRGRGGAGFSTGLKWEFCRKSKSDMRYTICNADEGDPGAFMNRSTLEGDPHSVLEGMIIASYAMGSAEGYIYVRAEYPLAIVRFKNAIGQAKAHGYLGSNIMGSGHTFNIHIREGAGAFVCGEETALMHSIEGKRGEPRTRPPFPASKGLWGKPSNINNVETYAHVPNIINHGAEWFSAMGTKDSKGTKVFSLVGKINSPGLIEVPMGIPMCEIIYEIGGGIPEKRRFKAVQTGGPSGGCIPAEHLDAKVDYETLKALGAIVGSGGIVVMDEDTCMVDVARYFLQFTVEESCGQCTPCRVGLRRMLDILERISSGKGRMEDLQTLEDLAVQVRDSSLCALGGTAPNPILTTLKYFRHEYEEHIIQRKCHASVCAALFDAPCQNTCPAETNVPGYIQLIQEGKNESAYELNLEDNPFPSICGRVCEHPCESRCQRAQFDEAIAIRELKRYCTDKSMEKKHRAKLPKLKSNGRKVAVVGGGPAGLSCAYFLARMGYRPTVFEASEKLGGMLRWAIPTYRLPHRYLDADIKNILDQGVEAKLNCRVGKDVHLSDLERDYDAVFLGVGAQADQSLGLEGENLPGIIHGLKLLRQANEGKNPALGKTLLVIGGGNVAVDVARTAKRMGVSKVIICYRREKDDMPAYTEECDAAWHEGIEFHFLVAPEKVIVKDGRAVGIQFRKNKMGKYDKWGRRKPERLEETIDVLADTIVTAIGQSIETDFATGFPGAITDKKGRISADKYTLATKSPKVFAGGDAVTGPSSVIGAIGQGKGAARNIDRMLSGEDHFPELKALSKIKYGMVAPKNEEQMVRQKPSELLAAERTCSFDEVVLCMDDECAQKEAKRCFRCDIMSKEGGE
ncbi:MAG: NADH-quinone oxidoreductase subunit NuoF [Thermoplasmata archaeon]|nr:NADH-quinone oxidoreductase subunit NuoF [Thermoplasmata archaeon]